MTVEKIVEPENLKIYAHIVKGKVANVSLWDGVSEWKPAEKTVEIPAGVNAGIGWDYDGKKFVDNRPVETVLYLDEVVSETT